MRIGDKLTIFKSYKLYIRVINRKISFIRCDMVTNILYVRNTFQNYLLDNIKKCIFSFQALSRR